MNGKEHAGHTPNCNLTRFVKSLYCGKIKDHGVINSLGAKLPKIAYCSSAKQF